LTDKKQEILNLQEIILAAIQRGQQERNKEFDVIKKGTDEFRRGIPKHCRAKGNLGTQNPC
jgi:hypothetical protein